ncbi:MAG: type III polyketide synthase, partial [Deltaproteobacteria bacterium]|nr:type III polyketide synthase [Deltaproteobacteria bacterium]
AAYVHDETMRTAVVNSLFGDGAAAAVLTTDIPGDIASPAILGFESHIIPEAIDAMRFDTVGGKLSFFLDRNIPYVIGNNVRVPVTRLLERFGLKQRHIAHWLVHSGGKKVIDSIKYNLGLTNHDVRHTRAILRGYGNLSSASVLFSLARLRDERIAKAGDYGVMIAMGPGTSIETALLRW